MSKKALGQNFIERQWLKLIQDLRSKTHQKIEKKSVKGEAKSPQEKYWQELVDYGSALDSDPDRAAILFEQYLYYQHPANFLDDGEKQALISAVKMAR